MATKTQTTPSAFPRIRFGFGPKSSRTHLTPDPPENPDDGDWYIPYNGPFELPPSVPRSKNRDSWGQLLGSVLSGVSNPGSPTSPADRAHERSGGHTAGGRIKPTLTSSGAYSSHPYRMSTDGAGSLGPTTTTTSRSRSTRLTPIITSSTAFAHIDTTGGVGEFPASMRRSPLQTSPQASTANRLSLANLLSFGGSTRKSRSDSGNSSHRPSVKRSRNGSTPTLDPLQSNRLTGIDAQPPPRSHSLAQVGPSTEHTPRQRSNTMIGTSVAPARDLSTHYDSPLPTHPYAYPHPSSHSGAPPRRAPIVSPPLAHSHSLDKGKGVDRSYQYPQPPSMDTLNVVEVPPHLRPTSRPSLLKTISAPNLRNLSRGLPVRKPTPSRGKSRWLSPETWCDALLFPRPRFMEHIDGEPPQPVGQRNVSMPSPKAHTLAHTGRRQWLHGSRSAVNLHVPNSDSSRGPPRAEPMLKRSYEGDGSFSRPRSFAQDDLALPSPVLSIVRCATIDILAGVSSFQRYHIYLGFSRWVHLWTVNAPLGGPKQSARFRAPS
jgi:serine/arginine repetitive matrix protein 2